MHGSLVGRRYTFKAMAQIVSHGSKADYPPFLLRLLQDEIRLF